MSGSQNHTKAFGSSAGSGKRKRNGLTEKELQRDIRKLRVLKGCRDLHEVKSVLAPLWKKWRTAEGDDIGGWPQISMACSYIDGNMVNAVDWSDYATHFDAIWVTQEGDCLAEFDGKLVEQDVKIDFIEYGS